MQQVDSFSDSLPITSKCFWFLVKDVTFGRCRTKRLQGQNWGLASGLARLRRHVCPHLRNHIIVRIRTFRFFRLYPPKNRKNCRIAWFVVYLLYLFTRAQKGGVYASIYFISIAHCVLICYICIVHYVDSIYIRLFLFIVISAVVYAYYYVSV